MSSVKPIPVKWLIIASLPFVCLLVILRGGNAIGVDWGEFGLTRDHGIWMIAPVLLTFLAGAVVELFLVPVSLVRLVRFPALRTFRNFGAVSFGAAYLVGTIAIVTFFLP